MNVEARRAAFQNEAEIETIDELPEEAERVIVKTVSSTSGNDRNNLRSQFARNLRLWRTERTMNRTELARVTGLSRAVLAKLESGDIAVGLDTIERLSNALQIEPSLLIGPLCVARPRQELREVREAKGFSQSKLAEMSGVSRVSINRIETGKVVAGPRAKRAIALALGVHPASIV